MSSTIHTTSNLTCDILVAGGGLAGLSCAIAAARQGSKIILCQDRSMLGGNASSEVRMHVVGANSFRECHDLLREPRETGLVEEIRLENAFRNPQRSPSVFDLILYEKCRAEKNLTLLLNTRITGTSTANGRITSARALRSGTEDAFDISAELFIDCTGDSALAVSAGAPFMLGREDKAAFNESFAPETADKKTLGSTILFMARKHNRPMPFIAPPWIRKFNESDFRLRPHATPDIDSGLEYGYWWLEWGGNLDTIKDDASIHHELLAIVLGVWDHVKNGGDHGAENWALDWFGVLPGKRESRRLVGHHILTESDILTSRQFPDAIAYGGWPIDLHPPEGIDAPNEEPCRQIPVPKIYDIPLRSCISSTIPNLLFAGRNLSATHVAFASTRVMATCSVVGEALGISAAFSLQNKISPIDLANNPALFATLRQRILDEDLFIIGAKYDNPRNLAPLAKITASSETPNGSSTNVVSPQTRSLDNIIIDDARTIPGAHRWLSAPGDSTPALELRWPNPVEVSSFEIIFDTGLHRHLTLSHSDAYHRKMHWGAGQPEMVKSYTLEIQDTSNNWHNIAGISSQYQRRSRHLLPQATKIQAARITVTSTWGIDHARIVALRAFSTN